MLVATCIIKIQLPGVHSLKEKRRILKSVLSKLGNEFNVAVAELDHHDLWQTTEIGLVTIGTEAGYLHSRMEKAVAWIDRNRPDIYIDEYGIRLL
jgi:uncharacterized protein YlxP (DUF503 family)